MQLRMNTTCFSTKLTFGGAARDADVCILVLASKTLDLVGFKQI
jgi:hypothetical protein